ncbi:MULTISPECIES: queuosine precursor transporter [Cysteiniphilum]|uniref:Queuosine precursor transporter n=1 Tax=Cysteiniphilum litorale TaxID=2056700 RepID=A0A8J2Z447_9GAMM|nr:MULTISPECIES: queuosine precursor transporter [Cysteiniphilum]GGF97864.1 membrane protein [Cysteiniphilum litorale]
MDNKKLLFDTKILIVIASLSAMIVIASDLLTYKLFEINGFTGSDSLFTFPIVYLLSDIVTELYGKKTARFLLYTTLFSEFLLDVGLGWIIHLPSPISFLQQPAYNQVIGTLPTVYWGALLALFISALINIFLMAKWQRVFNGKWYVLRSFLSTIIGLTIFTIIGYFIWFWGIKSVGEIIELIMVSLTSKVIVVLILMCPSYLFVRWLKTKSASL